MPKAPDWLLNLSATTPHLVEDSPQFRQAEQRSQLDNLNSAATDAMSAVRENTEQMRAQTEQLQAQEQQAQMGMMADQMAMLEQMQPRPTPLAGPDESFFPEVSPMEDTPMTPNVPGPADFAAPDQGPTPLDPAVAPMQEDPATEVQRISAQTGIPAQTVAAMTLLGRDIERLEAVRGQMGQEVPPPGPTPTGLPPAGNLDDPRMAPPAPTVNMDDPRLRYSG